MRTKIKPKNICLDKTDQMKTNFSERDSPEYIVPDVYEDSKQTTSCLTKSETDSDVLVEQDMKTETLDEHCENMFDIISSEPYYEEEEYLDESDNSIWMIHCDDNESYEDGEKERVKTPKKSRNLKKKKENAHVKKARYKSINPRVCAYCSEKFVTLKKLNEHCHSKHKQEYLTCNVCEKSFKSIKNLRQHNVLHSNKGKLFSCSRCGASFIEKRRLKLHNLIHLKDKPIKCADCDRTFSHRSNYKRHLLVHSELKPFKCECGREFSNSTKLKYHKNMHTRG